MWEETQLEKFTHSKLSESIGNSEAEAAWGVYVTARSTVIDYILPDIKGREPQLTDHGPRHIKDVMENAWKFVEDKETKCPVEMFVLCISILYHDVGNYFGRKNHPKRISKIFNETFPDNFVHKKKLRTLVMNIAGAHAGVAVDGTPDTLKFLQDDNLFKYDVNTQEIASVLRLSDELAEGPQRTSSFNQKNGFYDDDTMKFHVYADCCAPPHIIRKSGRIALSYHIALKLNESEAIVTSNGDIAIETLFNFIFERIEKLDLERKYCSHYSNVFLTDFKETSVVFEFWHEDEEKIEFSEPPLILNDLVLPGSSSTPIVEQYPDYAVEKMVRYLKDRIDG